MAIITDKINIIEHLEKKHISAIVLMILVVCVLIVFWPVSGNDFINYDDDIYVTDNIRVWGGLTWDNVKWAFGATEAGFWHPLVWLSLMADFSLFRLNAGGYHWTNVLFHMANTLLLFIVLQRMTGAVWRSAMVAVLFAIHPLHVEPVAWVAARKDVLSTLFWMLTLWSYAIYVNRPSKWQYLIVLFSFSLGLMSKPMVVTLPFVLLLLDYWPLHRYDRISSCRLIGEKIPLLLLSLPVIWVTFAAEQQIGALGATTAYPWLMRVSNAIVSYVIYIGKTIFPVGLSVYYPHPGQRDLWIEVFPLLLLLIGVTSVAAYFWKKRPYFTMGWLWYLGTLFPVVGIVQVGSHSLADRYTYVPLIGLFIVFCWGGAEILNRAKVKIYISFLISVLIIAAMGMLSALQVSHWQNGIVLAEHTLSVIGHNSGTLNNLGNALARQNRIDEAISKYKEALRFQPDYADCWNNLGNAVFKRGLAEQAIDHYEKALLLDPLHIKAHFNLAYAYQQTGKSQAALTQYDKIISIKPNFYEAYNNMGIIFAQTGNVDTAITSFNKALQLNPNYQAAKDNLALVLRSRQVIKRNKNDNSHR